jgi:hypothetical protein
VPPLNKDVEHNAIPIHGAPKIVLHTLDPDEHLIHVPLVPRSWPPPAQAVGKALAEFLAPVPNGLVGNDDTPFGQKEFNIPQAEAEHVMQPNSMTDDLRGKAMAIAWIRRGVHATSVAGLQPKFQTRLA